LLLPEKTKKPLLDTPMVDVEETPMVMLKPRGTPVVTESSALSESLKAPKLRMALAANKGPAAMGTSAKATTALTMPARKLRATLRDTTPDAKSTRRKLRRARSLRARQPILETMTAPQTTTPRTQLATRLRREARSDALAEHQLSAQLYELGRYCDRHPRDSQRFAGVIVTSVAILPQNGLFTIKAVPIGLT
jgi:hypothetical protein